jgi:sulfur carrier protein ThiS
MPVTFILRKQEIQLEGTLTLKEAFKQLGLSPEMYLAIRNGEMLTENDALKNGDVIKLIAVISGG